MLRTVRVNPQTSTKDLQHDLAAEGVAVHRSTIQRTLHKEMLYGRVMQRKPFLCPHHKQSRLSRTTRVHVERDHRVGRYVDAIIRHLERQASIQVVNNEEYDVRVLFCPIVSRAGTDIEAVLSRVRDGEPTIVMVLHHTFDSRAVIPNSSSYNREGLSLVDFLFSEDQGLLECERNNISFETAARYIERHAVVSKDEQKSDGKAMSLWEILPMFAVVSLFLCLDYRNSSCYMTAGMISGIVGGMVKHRLVGVAVGGAIGLAFMGLNAWCYGK
ncbi:hypothetical protein NFI96_024336 [Prochilodus magdalenae]|nr:hypothetical protein NFI96_024336 [Prochilodus magdalenae]